MPRDDKRAFGEQIESFAAVIDALLKKQKTRDTFRRDPMGTLEAYGIRCDDPSLRAKLQEELLSASDRMDTGADNVRVAPFVPFVIAAVAVEAAVRIGSESQPKDLERRMFEIDQGRVGMFLDSSAMQARISELEAEVAMLRNELGRA